PSRKPDATRSVRLQADQVENQMQRGASGFRRTKSKTRCNAERPPSGGPGRKPDATRSVRLSGGPGGTDDRFVRIVPERSHAAPGRGELLRAEADAADEPQAVQARVLDEDAPVIELAEDAERAAHRDGHAAADLEHRIGLRSAGHGLARDA